MLEEAENLLRRSYVLEKDDLTLSLSLATDATGKFERRSAVKISLYFPAGVTAHAG